MLLREIEIKNFRGLEKHKFQFDNKSLVILTAPNGNGKTSLIDAIEWCLTGNIYRLQYAFEKRNTNANERKRNRDAILKNKNHIGEETVVTLKMFNPEAEKEYIITRKQSEDTLENGGTIEIEINKEKIKTPEVELAKMIDKKTFYKYHFCDMQKTYNFLQSKRKDMENEFQDFSSDYSEAEKVVNNLVIYQADIVQRISVKEDDKVKEETLTSYRTIKRNYESDKDIRRYCKEKMYEAELTDTGEMTREQIDSQLEVLYDLGHRQAVVLLERIKESEETEKYQKKLNVLVDELRTKGQVIVDAIKKNAYKEDIRTAAEGVLKKYKEIRLTEENLEGYCSELFEIKNEDFTEKYWVGSKEQLSGIKVQLDDLNHEIDTLEKGNQVLRVMSSITIGRENLIQYREEMRTNNLGSIVCCPVCGSEAFDYIEEPEIAKLAGEYLAENRDLIVKKKKARDDLEQKKKELLLEQIRKAEIVLRQAIEKAEKETKYLTSLYQESKVYFDTVNELHERKEKYCIENLDTIEKVMAVINNNKVLVMPSKEKEQLRNELNRVFAIVNYSSENKTMETQLMEMRSSIEKAPEDFIYNEKLLSDKICSLRSYQNNETYWNALKQLEDAEKKNKRLEEEIKELKQFNIYAEERIKQINSVKTELKKKEYAQVGPYLYKIFRKLSRDVQIEGIKIENEEGGEVSLLDENGYSLLNMLSDGQLSVFMLSYFLGNIFRMSGTEKIPVYFVDDITACMDDINMLAFLDFIKYQLSRKNSVMKQLFFVTCDKRIEGLMKYKMESCKISYKEISIRDFRDRK